MKKDFVFSLVVFCFLQRFNLIRFWYWESRNTQKCNLSLFLFFFPKFYFVILPLPLNNWFQCHQIVFMAFTQHIGAMSLALQSHLLFSYFSLLYCQRHPYVSHFASVYRMNLSKGPLVNSSSEDNSKSSYGKCGAGAWRMHQSYDPLEANHMRDAHALYNPR